MCVCNKVQIRMYMKYAIKYETKYIYFCTKRNVAVQTCMLMSEF